MTPGSSSLRPWAGLHGPLATLTIALLCLPSVGGCGDEPTTAVIVTLEARPAVTELAQIEVTVSNDSESIQTSFDVAGRALPLTFSITPTGRVGTLVVSVVGRDSTGVLRGLGTARAEIQADATTATTVLLDPSDFVVNSEIAGDQRLSFFSERNGRQIATGDEGFAIVFVNDCATLLRCDVFGRRFDSDGLPIENGITETTDEFIANLSENAASIPAVGAGPRGSFIAWETAGDVRGVALDEGGTRHQELSEIILSNSDLLPTDVTVTAVANGDYVVAWSQGGEGAIRGRLVAFDGEPRTNPVTNDTADFPIATLPAGTPQRPALTATGTDQGFACVWRNGTDLRGRFFDASATPTTAAEITLTSFGDRAVLVGPHPAWTNDGALIAWGLRDPDSLILKDGQFQVQRFTASGAPAGPVRVLALATEPFPAAPHLATLESGAVGATWENCGANGDGSGCGIYFQLLRPTGLPIGGPIQVNTTERSDQTGPGIAAVGADRFAITWTDESQQAPDTTGAAVRARMIYPELDPTDGRLGARCGQPGTDACTATLSCMAGSDSVAHCHENCDLEEPNEQCVKGGICTRIADSTGCLF